MSNTRKKSTLALVIIAVFLTSTAGYYIGYTEAVKTAKSFYTDRIAKLTNAYNSLIITYKLDEMNSLAETLLIAYQETANESNHSKTIDSILQRMDHIASEIDNATSKLSCPIPEKNLIRDKTSSIRHYVSLMKSNNEDIPVLVKSLSDEITDIAAIIETCNTT